VLNLAWLRVAVSRVRFVRQRHWHVVALTLLAGAVGACDDEEKLARLREASETVRTVEQLRNAPNDAKRPRLAALEKLTCTAQDVCDLQRICTKAYRRHQSALDSARALRHAIGQDGGTSKQAAQASKLLSKAKRELERARFMTRQCARQQGRVVRAYDL
jgi:hypothetical protein